MSPAFEAYLARLYTDRDERSRFDEDPKGRGEAAGLSGPERDALAAIDRTGLEMAAESFQRKRGRARAGRRRPWSL